MLAWPHSGFSAYVGPAIAAADRAAVLRVARYGARAPVAESRLRYDAERAEVELASDAVDGPYVGVHRFAAVEFVARLRHAVHVRDRFHIVQWVNEALNQIRRRLFSGAPRAVLRHPWKYFGVLRDRLHGWILGVLDKRCSARARTRAPGFLCRACCLCRLA